MCVCVCVCARVCVRVRACVCLSNVPFKHLRSYRNGAYLSHYTYMGPTCRAIH